MIKLPENFLPKDDECGRKEKGLVYFSALGPEIIGEIGEVRKSKAKGDIEPQAFRIQCAELGQVRKQPDGEKDIEAFQVKTRYWDLYIRTDKMRTIERNFEE